MEKVLITGGRGLIGTALSSRLREEGRNVGTIDLADATSDASHGDVLDMARLEACAQGCAGIVHLAAVSRVIWGEQNPERCWRTNVTGTANVLRVALAGRPRPWVLFASSREVYGRSGRLPVGEGHALRPVNVYGRSKVEAEKLVGAAREQGLRAAIVRFSNVFGSVVDHADRVAPAFARAAATGRPLFVNGWNQTFDFTPLDDTVNGIVRMIEVLEREIALPAIHLVTGHPTTLGELAQLAVALGGRSAPIKTRPERAYDVESFLGDPTRAEHILGWRSTTPVEIALGRMIDGYRTEAHANRQDAARA